MNNYADQKNISLNSLFVENNPNLTYSEVYANALNKRITNIMLTDLGTPPSLPTLFDGNNVKGSYEGILYFMDNDAVGGSNALVNIPVPIRISLVYLGLIKPLRPLVFYFNNFSSINFKLSICFCCSSSLS